MAFAIPSSHPHISRLYNVEQAVGSNAANATSDVRLVQYMLRGIYGPTSLAVDGWMGPKTISWITRFQQDLMAGGTNVLIDGRVDRAFGQVSSVSKTAYTILQMNFVLYEKNPTTFQSIPNAVALSANPKPNPYNPKPKCVVNRIIISWNGTKYIFVTYDDGTKETIIVKGKFVENDGTHVIN